MTQRPWSDPQPSAAYRDDADAYDDWYRAPQRDRSRLDAEDSGRWRDEDDLPARRWGGMPGRLGVCVVIGSAALGGLVTAVTDQAPGAVLGVFLVFGAIVGSLAVRPRTGYLMIPVPSLAYLVAAFIAGLIHDRATDGSKATLAINATQWIAGGFVAMAAATGLVIVITAVRWRRKPQP